MFCRSLVVLFYFFFWPLCCLFFLDIQILITPLVSSNSSWSSTKKYARFNNRANILIPNMLFFRWITERQFQHQQKDTIFSRSSRWSIARHNCTLICVCTCGNRVSECLFFNTNSSIFQVYHGKEHINFHWFDGEVPFVLDLLYCFYKASSLKQQSADRHLALRGHIILIASQPVFALSP